MKKTVCLLLTVVIALALLVSCVSDSEGKTENPDGGVTVRLGGLKGATSMGLVKLLDDSERGETENKYDFTMAVTADELTPKLLRGELDVLAVPANLGAILYNSSDGAVQMAAVSTLGVLYIVEKGSDDIGSVADLRGKTLYATGKGTTPEYALAYILSLNGLDIKKDLTVEWKSEPTEIISLMAKEDSAVAMLPQPFVTVAGSKVEGLHIALDLNEEWGRADNGSMLITAGLMVRRQFAEEHPEEMKTFLKEYRASAEYVTGDPENAAALIEKYGIVKAAVAEEAIPYCNIVSVTGEEMKSSALGYLGVLYGQNPAAVGGTVPGDDFFLNYE